MPTPLNWTDGTGGFSTGTPVRRPRGLSPQGLAPQSTFDPYAAAQQGSYMGAGGAVGPDLRTPFGSVRQWYEPTSRDLTFEATGFQRDWGQPPMLDGFEWDPSRYIFIPRRSIAPASEGAAGRRARNDAYLHYAGLASMGRYIQPYRVSSDSGLPPWRQWALRIVAVSSEQPDWQRPYVVVSQPGENVLWRAAERAVQRDPELEGKTQEEVTAILARRQQEKYGDFKFAEAGTYRTADGRTATSYGPEGMQDVRDSFTWEDWIRDPTLGGRVALPSLGVNYVGSQVYSQVFKDKYGVGSGGWQRDPLTGAFREDFDKDAAWSQRIAVVRERKEKKRKEEEARAAAAEKQADKEWDEYVAEMEARKADDEAWLREEKVKDLIAKGLTREEADRALDRKSEIDNKRSGEGKKSPKKRPEEPKKKAGGQAAAEGAADEDEDLVTVPNVVKSQLGTARARLAKAKLKTTVDFKYDETKANNGRVLAQNPEGGSKLAENLSVLLKVGKSKAEADSEGKDVASVPDVTGMSAAGAKSKIRRAGLTPYVTKQTGGIPGNSKAAFRPGFVGAQNPSAGSEIAKGSSVHLYVGARKPPTKTGVGATRFGTMRVKGPLSVWSRPTEPDRTDQDEEIPPASFTIEREHFVPNYVGLTLDEARRKSATPGTYFTLNGPSGTAANLGREVVSQSPPAGSLVLEPAGGYAEQIITISLASAKKALGAGPGPAAAAGRAGGGQPDERRQFQALPGGSPIGVPDMDRVRQVQEAERERSRRAEQAFLGSSGGSSRMTVAPPRKPPPPSRPRPEPAPPPREPAPSQPAPTHPSTSYVPPPRPRAPAVAALPVIPDVRQLTLPQANAMAKGLGFQILLPGPKPTYPAVVVKQFPAAGERRPRGTTIKVVMSGPITWGSNTVPTLPGRSARRDTEMVRVPQINGIDAAKAVRVLRAVRLTPWALGLANNGVPMQFTTAYRQNPVAGTSVPVGTRVEFVADARRYSESTITFRMPRVVGLSGEDADNDLAYLNPRVSRIAHDRITRLSVSSSRDLKVARQMPLQGASVKIGVGVMLTFEPRMTSDGDPRLAPRDVANRHACQRIKNSSSLKEVDLHYQQVREAILKLHKSIQKRIEMFESPVQTARWTYVRDVTSRLTAMLPREGSLDSTGYVPGYIRNLGAETPPEGWNGPVAWAWCAKHGGRLLADFRGRVDRLEDFYAAAEAINFLAEAIDRSLSKSWGPLGDALNMYKIDGEDGFQKLMAKLSREFLAAAESDSRRSILEAHEGMKRGLKRLRDFEFWDALAVWLDLSSLAGGVVGLTRIIINRVLARRALREVLKRSRYARELRRLLPEGGKPPTGSGGSSGTPGAGAGGGSQGQASPGGGGGAGTTPPSGTAGRSTSRVAPQRTRTRLPSKNGTWDGARGESNFHSTKPEVLSVTGGKGVPFKNGRPDFSRWSRIDVNFKPGVLNGKHGHDASKTLKRLMRRLKLPTQKAVKAWLRANNLRMHHASPTRMQLLPAKLHDNIPHIGTASDLRAAGG